MAIGTTAAILGSAVIGAGASAIGARQQANAANRSAQAVQDATDSSNQLQWNIYQQQRADSEPWRQFGLQALGQLSSLYNFNWQAPQSMTGGQWQQQPGNSGGGGYSGGGAGGGLIGRLADGAGGAAALNQAQAIQPGAPYDGTRTGGGGPVMGGVNALLGDQGLTQPGGGAGGGVLQPLVNGGPGDGTAGGNYNTNMPMVTGSPTTTGQPGQTGGQQPLNTAPFYASPDYQFRLNEGNRNHLNAFANTGNLDSGAAQRALLTYGQNMASGEFNNYRNFLMQGAGMGQVQTQSNNALASNYANNVSNNNYAAANARSSAYQQAGNAWAQGAGGIAGAGMWALNNYPWGK